MINMVLKAVGPLRSPGEVHFHMDVWGRSVSTQTDEAPAPEDILPCCYRI